MSEQKTTFMPTYALPPKKRSPIRRFGCIVAVIIWFAILLLPCFCLVLASQGEIAIRLGDAPEQSFRLWLLSESDQRGIGISRPSVFAGENSDQICVQTNINFVLWAGTAEASTYCECYTRSDNTQSWSLTSSAQQSCQP
jgi:hypothetical protein